MIKADGRRIEQRTARMPRRPRSLRAIRRHNVRAAERPELACTSTPARMAQESRCKSEPARPEAKERDSGRAEVRQLERFFVRVSRQFLVREPLANDLQDCQVEPFRLV